MHKYSELLNENAACQPVVGCLQQYWNHNLNILLRFALILLLSSTWFDGVGAYLVLSRSRVFELR